VRRSGALGAHLVEHDVVAALGELPGGLGAGEPVFPFHPHVTVAHHLHDAALDRAYAVLATFECAFLVDSFALYVHDDAAGWTAHCTFGLR